VTALTKQAIEYAASRGIGEKTLTSMRVVGGKARFEDGTHEAIVFRYLDADEKQVNFKARAIDNKKYKQQGGGVQCAYNWWQVRDSDLDVVWITEGEFDALALVEAGISPHSVISTPNGAPAAEIEEPAQAKKYGWLLDAMSEGLTKAKIYIIATDNDDPGRALRHDMVAILGPAKVAFLDWPDGIKDANEFLLKFGADELAAYLETSSQPWPVEGIFRLSEIPEPPALELWDIGFPELGGAIKMAPTMVSAVTGWPGHGKSHVFQQVWFSIARRYGIKVAVFSAETRTKPFLRRNMRQFYWGILERNMTEHHKREADDFIEAHFLFLDHPSERPTVGWIIDKAEVAVQRHGCRGVLIDPWNKLEEDYDPREMNETRWIGKMLDLFIDMSRGLNIHTQIIAHPAKPDATLKKFPPDLYSIAGSAHWNNRVDQGFCIHREKIVEGGQRQTEAELRCLKSRFEELGYPGAHGVRYDVKRGIFVATECETRTDNIVARMEASA